MLSKYEIGTEGDEANPTRTFTEKVSRLLSTVPETHVWRGDLKFVVVPCTLESNYDVFGSTFLKIPGHHLCATT